MPFEHVKSRKFGLPEEWVNYGGLTKREMFAMHFMASWINHHGAANDYGFSANGAAESAIECADALLAKLNETK